jgi:hypothetical protein
MKRSKFSEEQVAYALRQVESIGRIKARLTERPFSALPRHLPVPRHRVAWRRCALEHCCGPPAGSTSTSSRQDSPMWICGIEAHGSDQSRPMPTQARQATDTPSEESSS